MLGATDPVASAPGHLLCRGAINGEGRLHFASVQHLVATLLTVRLSGFDNYIGSSEKTLFLNDPSSKMMVLLHLKHEST